MDIVRKKISDLRGEVEIESEIGKGTSFTIRIQQTLSIIDCLLIETNQTYFMLPISEIEVCDERKHSEISEKQNKHIEFKACFINHLTI